MSDLQKILDDLRKPFHPSAVSWKPGATKGDRALALAYADLRAYMDRLDEVCGSDWSVAYEPWGDDRIICRLTIMGITRSSTGETTNESEKSEIGGTVAEAQAFKRASAMFGLGRYLYNLPSGWVDFDPATKKFTDKAKAKLTSMLVQHYRQANSNTQLSDLFAGNAEQGEAEPEHPEAQGTPPHNRFWGLGKSVFGNDWDMAREWLISKWTARNTPDNTRNSASELTDDEKTQLGDYMNESVSALQEAWRKQKKFIEQHKVTP